MTMILGPSGQPVQSMQDAGDIRRQVLRQAYDSYDGHPKKPLLRRAGEPDDNLLISLAGLIVDKGVSYLFGEDVGSQVSDKETEPQQDWLDECWRRNKRALTLQKLATNGGICGHAFARLLDTRPFPRVIVLDPQTVDVVTDPDDIETVRRYTITPPPRIEEEGSEPVQRRTLIVDETAGPDRPDDAPAQWVTHDQVQQAGAWMTVLTTPWPYPFSPIVDCQNLPRPNDYWGKADLSDDVLHVLDAINRVASHYNKIIRVHAHPKVYTTGMGARTIDTAIDSVIHLPSETAKLQALEMQSDLASTKALLDSLLNYLSMMVRTPLVALGMPDNLGAISGVALQIRYQPLLEKTKKKQRTYGYAVQELDRRLLDMGGHGDAIITTLQWPELLPTDLLMERQVWVLDESLGLVSKETLSSKAGYDWAEEQKRRQAELDAERVANVAAGLNPDGSVPAPEPLGAPQPDIAKTAKSR